MNKDSIEKRNKAQNKLNKFYKYSKDISIELLDNKYIVAMENIKIILLPNAFILCLVT